VPRHVIVPCFYDGDVVIRGDDPDRRAEWFSVVYTDESLVTQRIPVPGADLSWSTSSSTMPSLMARMLSQLEISGGERVLEIGTGTGYNAALLAYRVGDGRVVSVDIDPALVDTARRRLGSVGYSPTLVAGDGAAGVASAAPYDRIIATCAVPSIPPEWIRQLASDGIIVADVRGEIASCLIKLRKTDEQEVRGRFLSEPGHFMWLRRKVDNPLRDGGVLDTTINVDGSREGLSRIDFATELADPDLRFMLQLRCPHISNMYVADEKLNIYSEDGAWVRIDTRATDGRFRFVEAGTPSLVRLIEDTVDQWNQHGRPARSRYGMTASISAEPEYWLDDPSTPLWTAATPH
jgi:protein-L-isoaspartate(D-aspartate) O-methyltransferase